MPGTDVELYAGGSLAIASEQTEWTAAQLAVLRSAGVSEQVTQAELTAFLHECQRTKLDPFTRQIYLIGRYDKKVGRDVFRSQTGIDGYRVIANRVIREENADLEYEDTLWCGPDGVWHDVWLSQRPPAAAKVVVLKNGKRFPAIATLAEYAARYPDGNPYPMWKRMPSNQLAKCAEALALRKAFPQDLAGIYTAEEMEQADARAEHVETADAQPKPFALTPEQEKQLLAMKRDLAILIGKKLGPEAARKRHAVMSQRFERAIASFDDLSVLELRTALRELDGMRDFVPPRDDARYNQLHAQLAAAPLESIDSIMSSAIEARDAGEISDEQWKLLDEVSGTRATALFAQESASAPQPEEARV